MWNFGTIYLRKSTLTIAGIIARLSAVRRARAVMVLFLLLLLPVVIATAPASALRKQGP